MTPEPTSLENVTWGSCSLFFMSEVVALQSVTEAERRVAGGGIGAGDITAAAAADSCCCCCC